MMKFGAAPTVKRFGNVIANRCLALMAATLMVPLAGACTQMPLLPPSNARFDPAALARMTADSERMVVVAVANPSETVSILAGTSIGAYDGAPGYSAFGSARATLTALASEYHLQPVLAWPIVPLQVHCAVLEVTGSQTRSEVLQKLTHDRRVKLAQPLQSFRTLGAVSATAYEANYADLQRGMREIDAPAAQRISQGQGVRVAIIDTGVDTTHPELAGRIAMTRDFVDQDKTRFNRDVHGTAVAGVIAANPAGGRGVIGVAPRARILAFKACWQLPSNAETSAGPSFCNSLTLALALSVAIESHANVINLSLSGPPDPLLGELVQYALKHGIVVVGAVPPNGDMQAFPIGIPNVIGVDVADGRATGATLRAPGHDVLTLTPGGHYDFLSGSSFSAAYVSGIAALLLSVDPLLDVAKVTAALKSSGAGNLQIVNACGALAAIGGGACETLTVAR